MCILERTENSIYRSRSVKDENNTNHPIFLLDPPLYFNSSQSLFVAAFPAASYDRCLVFICFNFRTRGKLTNRVTLI